MSFAQATQGFPMPMALGRGLFANGTLDRLYLGARSISTIVGRYGWHRRARQKALGVQACSRRFRQLVTSGDVTASKAAAISRTQNHVNNTLKKAFSHTSTRSSQNNHPPMTNALSEAPTQSSEAPPGERIKSMFDNSDLQLQRCSYYYFDQQGKSIRPMIMLLMAKATSRLFDNNNPLYGVASEGQRTLALIAEMIHTSSLLHDDVIDEATTRRNKESVNAVFGDTQAIYAGDYVLAKAAMLLASLNSTEVVSIMSQILDDLVSGEFMQLQNKKEAKNNPALRFELYLQKTYHKTASLLACGCRATAALVGHDQVTCDRAFQYGKDIGMAFQVIDDVLDYVSSSEEMGKPTAADLKLGLATAPVLFAAEEYPELNVLINRRFKAAGDVERARELVGKSKGLERSRDLAQKYCDSAIATLASLPPSPEKDGLIALTNAVLNRSK